jgi:hypothetical protein
MIKVSDLPLNGLQNTRPASNHERNNRDEKLSFNGAFLYWAHPASTILVHSICHKFLVMGYWEYSIAYVINCVDSDEKCLTSVPWKLISSGRSRY